jgi:chorismate--pyruvate lyase
MATLLEPAATLWLPGPALNCYEGNAQLRSWLLTPGLLTHRVRAVHPESFALQVVGEYADGADHLREIQLTSGGRPWIFAQTRVPAATLIANKWLARIGSTPLGEALAAHGAVTRSDFEYAQLAAEQALIVRAFSATTARAQTLWVRRSTFYVDGAPLYLQEAFMPIVATAAL